MSTPTTDTTVRVGRSVLQHGPLNDRVYLMRWGGEEAPVLIGAMRELARQHGYGKLFGKVPASLLAAFRADGFACPARIPGFFGGREDGCFVECFLQPQRQVEPDQPAIAAILERCRACPPAALPALPEGLQAARAEASDMEALAALYRQVFATYPFPVHDPDYLRGTLDHVFYLLIRRAGELVAAASCEMDREWRYAEMTDFAVLPDQRGQRLALHLLHRMEPLARAERMLTACTIARAVSGGMNVTFQRGGYRFAGTLIRNTCISGSIESMNVWCKPLRPEL